jgi:hypothetical protein
MSNNQQSTVVQIMQIIAAEGYRSWDGDRDMHAGKILKCLAGLSPGYRPDLDAALLADRHEHGPQDCGELERLRAENAKLREGAIDVFCKAAHQ